MEWLYHKKPLFLMHWKDGKVPQSVQDKVVVIPGGDALKSLQLQSSNQQSQRSWQHAEHHQAMHQHARSGRLHRGSSMPFADHCPS